MQDRRRTSYQEFLRVDARRTVIGSETRHTYKRITVCKTIR